MRNSRRRVSAGTVLMLVVTTVVLLSSAFLWFRLRSGEPVNLSGLTRKADQTTDQPVQGPAGGTDTSAAGGSSAASGSDSGVPAGSAARQNVPEAAPTQTGGTVTVTAAGTLAIEKNIRQSAYASDTKVYDFTDIMSLLAPRVNSDLNTVFLENLLMDNVSVSETVVPACAADLPLHTGFNFCLMGFDDAWVKKQDGVNSTLAALRARGITPLGMFSAETEKRFILREVNGIRVALMQYTSRISSSVRKSMQKAGYGWAVPTADAESIAADLAEARSSGAEICIVYVDWGKKGAKTPTKDIKKLAQQIADSGADVIIGCGAREIQTAEYLAAADGRQVLCSWCLGTLMSDDRNSSSRIGGYLLHMTFRKDGAGRIMLESAAYTPTYVWRYSQDGKYYYKCLPSNMIAPDGMNMDQTKAMTNALDAVRKTLNGSPLTER